MKYPTFALRLLITMLILSCNNGNNDGNTTNTEIVKQERPEEKESETVSVDSDSIIKILQGKWKEPDYPFRLIEFKNREVKFTEEGVIEPPAFKTFAVARNCPFEVTNIKSRSADDLFLVMLKDSTCERLKVFNDTLTLSGFSTNTNSDYHIVYSRIK